MLGKRTIPQTTTASIVEQRRVKPRMDGNLNAAPESAVAAGVTPMPNMKQCEMSNRPVMIFRMLTPWEPIVATVDNVVNKTIYSKWWWSYVVLPIPHAFS